MCRKAVRSMVNTESDRIYCIMSVQLSQCYTNTHFEWMYVCMHVCMYWQLIVKIILSLSISMVLVHHNWYHMIIFFPFSTSLSLSKFVIFYLNKHRISWKRIHTFHRLNTNIPQLKSILLLLFSICDLFFMCKITNFSAFILYAITILMWRRKTTIK